MRTGRRVGGVVALLGSAFATLALAAPGNATATTAEATVTPVAQDVSAAADDWYFRADGVRLFSLPDGNSGVRGLAYANQTATHHGYWPQNQSPSYTCDNGVTTNIWADVTDNQTGVRGWVPNCNIVNPPAPTPPQ